ncbi:hypothetical protein [Archangium lipolyticum]|uniref:hypothetical protein n=1 Tax=Archangium lipolyticum TaxID=2970465 RepID=UPI00214A8774|nr:hypothetical protein [Archangium lipolyticum]
MLLHFISDLLRNPGLQREFSKAPKATMAKAGLSEQQQEALHKGDLNTVTELIRTELSSVELFAAVWVKAVVEIASVGPIQASPGEKIQLTVKGDFFSQGAVAVLKMDNMDLPAATATIHNAGNRGSSLTGTVQIPSNAPVGVYSVVVVNPDGYYGLKENAFTVA